MTIKIRPTLTRLSALVRRLSSRRRLIATLFVVAFIVPVFLHAQEVIQPGVESVSQLGLPDGNLNNAEDLRLLIARIIRWVLGFVGLLAVGVVMYGGYLWMTSAGNQDRVSEAKTVLRNGLIGLAIIIASFAIVSFIINFFTAQLNNAGNGGNPGFTGCRNCIARGGDFIEDHYPDWNERVPRDIDILITFAEPVFVAEDTDNNADKSFIKNAQFGGTCGDGWWCGDADPEKFYLVYDPAPGEDVRYESFRVYTRDQRLFVITPNDLLGLLNDQGDPVETRTAAHVTKVSPISDVEQASNEYVWLFTVTTELDNTPPRITEITPPENNSSDRNDTVIINFDDVMHPVAVTGTQDTSAGINFSNLAVYADGNQVDGEFLIGNDYRTVWFRPKAICPVKNSCNMDIYCLPENADVRVVVKAATLKSDNSCVGQTASADKPAAACSPIGSGLFNGAVDISKNSLDGSRTATLVLPSGNGTAEGPAGNPVTDAVTALGDTFAWTFETNDQFFISAPQITALSPSPDEEGISTVDPFVAAFNRTMLPATNYKVGDTIYRPVRMYQQSNSATDAWTLYQGGVNVRQSSIKVCSNDNALSCTKNSDCGGTNKCLNVCGNDNTQSCTLDNECVGTDNKCGASNFNINHTGLVDPNRGGQARVTYEPRIGSTIQDRWQNCFYVPTAPGITNSLYPNGPGPDRNVNDTSVFGSFN